MSEEPLPSDVPERESLERPEHGGRLLARLVEAGTDGAVYEVHLATASASVQGRASVQEGDGRVEVASWQTSAAPPSWLVQAAHALLRSAWQRRRAGHPWPRRLARWRPSPEESEG